MWSEEQRNDNNNHQNHLISRAAENPIAARCDIDVLSYEREVYYNVGQCSYECFYCHALGFEDENKEKKNTKRNYGSLCCNLGMKMFPKCPDIPPSLQLLYTSQTDNAKHFQKAIRFFNAGMAMASLQVNDSTVYTGGPSAFKVYGQMHHTL